MTTQSAARAGPVPGAATAKPREVHNRADCASAESEPDRLAAYIQRLVDTAPPLTPEQRDRLAVLLRGAVDPR